MILVPQNMSEFIFGPPFLKPIFLILRFSKYATFGPLP